MSKIIFYTDIDLLTTQAEADAFCHVSGNKTSQEQAIKYLLMMMRMLLQFVMKRVFFKRNCKEVDRFLMNTIKLILNI